MLVEQGRISTAKVPTAPQQEESVLAAARAVSAGELDRFTHGTTVATNAWRVRGRKASDKTIERRSRRYGRYAGLAFWLFLTRDWVAENP